MKLDFKKVVIAACIVFFIISAFRVRLKNFINADVHTTDEVAYYQIAWQLKDTNFRTYNSIPFAFFSAVFNIPEEISSPTTKAPEVFENSNVLFAVPQPTSRTSAEDLRGAP